MAPNDIEITHGMLIDAVCGAGFPTIPLAEAMVAIKYATPIGNQHNPEWAWNRPMLAKLSTIVLAALYLEIKNAD